MTKSSPLEGVETLIAGHVCRRLRVEEADVGSTVARMRRDLDPNESICKRRVNT